MILRFVLPYMSYEDVGKIKSSLSKEDLKFYFIERFNLTGNDARIINDELELYPALMERLVNGDKVMDTILKSQLITDSRLKIRMYLAVKRNDNRLMSYFNDNFYMINNQMCNLSVSLKSISELLLLPFPFVLDGRSFEYLRGEQVIRIKNSENSNVVCTVDLYRRRALLLENGYENKDIAFMLGNVELVRDLLYLYNTKKKRKIENGTDEYRRPKIRRRQSPC